MEINITSEALKIIKMDAESRYPNECCGFFYGSDNPKMVTDVKIIANSKEGDQRRRFEISPEDYLRGERYAIESNLELLGIYHSHPDHPAIPSEHDRLQAVPVFSYVIVSIVKGKFVDVTSWVLNENEKFEQEIVTIKK